MPKLVGKKIAAYLWAGPGTTWRKKEKHCKLEDDRIVSASFFGRPGGFLVRCKGATCEAKLTDRDGKTLATIALRLPRGRK